MKRILILGGARETAEAADALRDAGHGIEVYWSRDATAPELPRCDALRHGLMAADAVLDVTHVFDGDLRRLAKGLVPDLPGCRYGRALWSPQAGDSWTMVEDIPSAVAALPQGARVFAATGRDSAEVLQHHDGRVFLRQLHDHDADPPRHCTFVFGVGPFEVSAEISLFRELQVDVVVARNVGGAGSAPKLAAARALGLPVIMIQPPALEFGPPLTSTEDLLKWAGAL